jgi:hypothetical protein
MRICVHVQPNDAMSAGHDEAGRLTVTLPVANLTDAQQRELANYQTAPGDWPMYDYELPKRPPIHVAGPASAGAADVAAYLDRLAEHRAAKLAAEVQARNAANDAFITAAGTYLATDMRDDHLRLLANEAPTARRELLTPRGVELLDQVRRRESEARAELKQRHDAAQAAADATERAARVAWINAHGSQRLRRLLSEDIEHRALFHKEKAEHARGKLPLGWALLADLPEAVTMDPENSEPETLLLLDLARQSVPGAWLSRFVITTTDGEKHAIEMPVSVQDGYDIVFTFPHSFKVDDDEDDDEDDTAESTVERTIDGAVKAAAAFAASRKRAAADSYATLMRDINAMSTAANVDGREDRAATLAALKEAVNAVAKQHGVEITSIT